MRAKEFLSEDEKTKSIVLRYLQKKEADDPLFSDIYRLMAKGPMVPKLDSYILNRKDPDMQAEGAAAYLIKTIPTLADKAELRRFLNELNAGKDFIDIKKLMPRSGMNAPAPWASVLTNPVAIKLFEKIFLEFNGKKDAGPGEAAFAILSPSITYGEPGDIKVNGRLIEVKGSRSPTGAGGRMWGPYHVDQTQMIKLLPQLKGQPNPASLTVKEASRPFANPKIAKPFITAACNAWFGKPIPILINSFGTPAFEEAWLSTIYESYRERAGWDSAIFLGIQSYQYVNSGIQFATKVKKSTGDVCRVGSKQTREMAPQIQLL